MAQEIVTARDVAAPAEVTLQFMDAQPICAMLNEALAAESYRRTAYSEQVQSVFQLAWAVASHKQSRQVTVFHLAYALVCGSPEAGKALAQTLNCDAALFAVGSILKLLPLGLLGRPESVISLSVDAARWIGEAAALALKRGDQSELLPTDLVEAVRADTIPRSVRGPLRAAARLGTARGHIVIGKRAVDAPASPSEIIKQLEEVEKGPAFPGGDFADLVEQFEDFEERYGVDSDLQKQALTRIEATIENRLATIEPPAVPFDDVMRRLATIDQRVLVLGGQIPRPPSGATLATAIVGVLLLGAAAGLALTHWQSRSNVTQAATDTTK